MVVGLQRVAEGGGQYVDGYRLSCRRVLGIFLESNVYREYSGYRQEVQFCGKENCPESASASGDGVACP